MGPTGDPAGRTTRTTHPRRPAGGSDPPDAPAAAHPANATDAPRATDTRDATAGAGAAQSAAGAAGAGAADPTGTAGADGLTGRAGVPELGRLLHAGPFHLALRAALAARGLPLHRVQHRLAARGIKLGVTSLSYWQQGARRPRHAESLRAVTALEQILELPDGALLRLLTGPESAPGPARPASRSYRALVSVGAAVERLVEALDLPPDGGLHSVGHHERVRIGPAGELWSRESQQIVRAHRDGVDRYLVVHHGDPGCDASRVRVTAYENCRTGRVRCHPAAGVVVAELLFDARLRRGDTYVFGYGVEDGTGARSGEYVRGFSYAGGQYMLQVRFDEAALPVRCRRFARSGPRAPHTGLADLTPSGRHRAVHLVEQTVRRGILGIAWEWA